MMIDQKRSTNSFIGEHMRIDVFPVLQRADLCFEWQKT